VDPFDTAALSGALERVMHDDSLRRALVERGHRRVEGFSWSRAATDMAALYRRAAER